MTDKAVKFTASGVKAQGVGSVTFDLPLGTGTLSETDATYFFEINVVIHSGTGGSQVYYPSKWFSYAVKRLGVINGVGSAQSDYNPNTNFTVTTDLLAGNVVVEFDFSNAINETSDQYWRAFVDIYVKDDA